MRLGADSSKKTIAAGALFLVAIVMFIRMVSGSSSSNGAAPTATATAHPAPAPAKQARHPLTRNRARGKTEKSSAPVTPNLDPRLNLAQLKETEDTTYSGNGRNIFMATEEPKIDIPKPVASGLKDKQAQVAPPEPPKYVPPPINLKFFGFASGPDHKRVFLAQGDDVFVAKEGDIVQRRYKIVKINNTNIEVLDVLSNNRQTIPLTAG